MKEIIKTINTNVTQKQRNKQKHTFSIGVSLRTVAWALFHTESKSTTNYGNVPSTEKREEFYCLNLRLLFVTFSLGAEVLSVFFLQKCPLFTVRNKLRL